MAASFQVKIRIRAQAETKAAVNQAIGDIRRLTQANVRSRAKLRNRAGGRIGRPGAAGATGFSAGALAGRGGFIGPIQQAPSRRRRRGGGIPIVGAGAEADGGFGGGRAQRKINQAAVFGGLSSSLGRISRTGGRAFAAPVKAAAEFERVMTAVGAKTGETHDQVQLLIDDARRLGADARFQFSATEVGEAQGFLAQAGFNIKQIQGSIESTLDLAAAAGEDLGFSSDFLSDVTKSFRVIEQDSSIEEVSAQMRRFADVSVRTTNSSNTNLRQLAGALLRVGPVATTAGVELEEAAGAIGVLANAGIKGTKAGTDLRNILLKLSAPTTGARKALAAIGLTKKDLQDSKGNLLDLTSTFRILDAALDKSFGPQNKTKKSAVFDALFGKRTTAGAFVLAEAARSGSLTGQIAAGGAGSKGKSAAEVAKLKAATTAGRLKAARAAFESLQIEIGNNLMPIVLEAVKVFIPMVKTIASFVAQNPGLTQILGTVVIAGTALAGVLSAAASVATLVLATSAATMKMGGAAAIATPQVAGLGGAMGGAGSQSARFAKGFQASMGIMTAAVAGFTVGSFLAKWIGLTDDSGGEGVRGAGQLLVSPEKRSRLASLKEQQEDARENVDNLSIFSPERVRKHEESKLTSIGEEISQIEALISGRVKSKAFRERVAGEGGDVKRQADLRKSQQEAEASSIEALEVVVRIEDGKVKGAKVGRRSSRRARIKSVETGHQTEL